MAGGDLLEAHHQSDVSCKERHPVDPNGTPPRTPPRTRAERLACGLPAYINRNLDLLAAPRDIPQVDEPWRARPILPTTKPRHAAPGAFELPMERLKELPWRPELVVGVAQEELNRWLNNISNEISHEDRDIDPVFINAMDLESLRIRAHQSLSPGNLNA